MHRLDGICSSPGIAIGKAYILEHGNLSIPRYTIAKNQIDYELTRFGIALEKSKKDFIVLRTKIVEELSEDEGKLLDSHLIMIEDPALIQAVRDRVQKDRMNCEWVLFQVVDELVKKINQIDNDYFRERAIDVFDIGKKIMHHLLSRKSLTLDDLKEDVIIIASNLTVSDTASLNKDHCKAFVTEIGGKTSHTAILARTLGIPAVEGIRNIFKNFESGDLVIVDGNHGVVIVNPDSQTIKEYTTAKNVYLKYESELKSLRDLIAETKDGNYICLKANMEIPSQEIDSVFAVGADGIGLYRSEFLYLRRKGQQLPDEEYQFSKYKFILKKMKNKSVTIRTIDLGGDKIIPVLNPIREANPNMGWRAIRVCLTRTDIFKNQLRALLRASVYGKLKIMFPLISGMDEIDQSLEILENCKDELRKEKIKFNNNIEIGLMIEIPSAALTSDQLAKKVDFFSLGTNDLIQYTIAVDRGNEKVAYLYEPLHPAVLRLIKLTVENANNAGIPVSICGEMAGDPVNAIILIGLGIDELSMSSMVIPSVKRAVRSVTKKEACELADKILKMGSVKEINDYVHVWMEERLSYLWLI